LSAAGGAPEDYREPQLAGSGASDYERYLRTDELLALQKTPAEWAHRDELLFTAVHQTSELWLKFAAGEVDEAATLMESGEPWAAVRLLRRAVLALDYVTTSLAMLEQMSPWEYQEIRVVLGHGSGFDSPGFRAVAEVTRRAGRAFTRLVADAGLELVELYQRGREFEALYQAAEALTDWDERIFVWRFRHYATVARSIGEDTTGTQGTPVAVLGKLIAQRQLPDLWKARATLVERFDAAKASGSEGVSVSVSVSVSEGEGVSEREGVSGTESEGVSGSESEIPQPEETDGHRDD
jgi:tryptophan 2,3-dioxygenase